MTELIRPLGVENNPKWMQNTKSHAYERLRRRHQPDRRQSWLLVSQVDDLQNAISSLDPKTAAYKDYLPPVPLRVPHGIDFSTYGMVAAGSGYLGRLDPKTGKFTSYESVGSLNALDQG
jgi:hypothetical protein